MAMDVAYDPYTHVYSVDLADGEIARTVRLDEDRLVDVAADGRVLSVEILDPDNARWEEIAERFDLGDQLAEILAAVENTVPAEPPTPTRSTLFISFVEPRISYADITFVYQVGLGENRSVPTAPARNLTLTVSD